MEIKVLGMDKICPENTQNRKEPTTASSKERHVLAKVLEATPQAVRPWPSCFSSLSFNSVKAADHSRPFFSDIQAPLLNGMPAQGQEGCSMLRRRCSA